MTHEDMDGAFVRGLEKEIRDLRMTLLDQFAMAAMQANLQAFPYESGSHEEYMKAIAEASYDMANVMLKEREWSK